MIRLIKDDLDYFRAAQGYPIAPLPQPHLEIKEEQPECWIETSKSEPNQHTVKYWDGHTYHWGESITRNIWETAEEYDLIKNRWNEAGKTEEPIVSRIYGAITRTGSLIWGFRTYERYTKILKKKATWEEAHAIYQFHLTQKRK